MTPTFLSRVPLFRIESAPGLVLIIERSNRGEIEIRRSEAATDMRAVAERLLLREKALTARTEPGAWLEHAIKPARDEVEARKFADALRPGLRWIEGYECNLLQGEKLREMARKSARRVLGLPG